MDAERPMGSPIVFQDDRVNAELASNNGWSMTNSKNNTTIGLGKTTSSRLVG